MGTPLIVEDHAGPAPVRHGRGAIATIGHLVRNRPDTVFLQYSWLLLVIVATYRMAMPCRVQVICDCHNKALQRTVDGALGILFQQLKAWSLAHTHELWVASDALVSIAEQYGRRVRVVPDPPPRFPTAVESTMANLVVVVSSFAVDEPFDEVLDAARQLEDLRFLITGRPPRWTREIALPANVTLTGFMPDAQYVRLLQRAAVIAAFTRDSTIVQCAGHEALAAGRPIVMSDSTAARTCFSDAAVYVEPRADQIARGIRLALGDEVRAEAARRIHTERRDAFSRIASTLAAVAP